MPFSADIRYNELKVESERKGPVSTWKPLVQDRFSRTMVRVLYSFRSSDKKNDEEIITSNLISISLVFATKIHLDILNTLEQETSRGLGDLQATSLRLGRATMDYYRNQMETEDSSREVAYESISLGSPSSYSSIQVPRLSSSPLWSDDSSCNPHDARTRHTTIKSQGNHHPRRPFV
jgi:hypothetical protein